MKPIFSNFLTRVIALALFVMSIIVAPSATAAFKYLSEGMKAPELSGVDLKSGEKISTRQWLGDNLIIVVFWSTWSPRSLEELQSLKELHAIYQDQPIKFIAVNVDGQNISPITRDKINSTLADLDLPFPVIIDDKLSIFYEFGVIAVPSTAVLDSSGVLKYGPAGFSLTTKDRIVDSIDVFLGLKKPDKVAQFRDGYRPKNKSSRFYNMALNLGLKKSWERALSILDSAEAADSMFAGPHTLRGDIMIRLERYEDAQTSFAKAIKLDSMVVAAWAGWGQALLKSGTIEEAIAKLKHALDLDSEYTPAFLDLGMCLAQQGLYDDAIDSLNKAKELNFANPTVHYYLGQVYRQAGNDDKATESYIKALELLYPSD